MVMLEIDILRQQRGNHFQIHFRLLVYHSLDCRKPALLPSRKEIRDERFAQLIARAFRPARVSGLELVLNRWNALSRILSVVSGTSTILHLTFRSSMVHSDCVQVPGRQKG